MKQLKDGGLAFYWDMTKYLKRCAWSLLLIPIFWLTWALDPDGPRTPQPPTLSNKVIAILVIYTFVFVIWLIVYFIFVKKQGCTVYEQYITWKDDRRVYRGKKQLFFQDLQGFFIATGTVYDDGIWCLRKGEVIYFVAKGPQTEVSSYHYYAWLSEQDQELLVTTLQEKGLAQLPENYKPN